MPISTDAVTVAQNNLTAAQQANTNAQAASAQANTDAVNAGNNLNAATTSANATYGSYDNYPPDVADNIDKLSYQSDQATSANFTAAGKADYAAGNLTTAQQQLADAQSASQSTNTTSQPEAAQPPPTTDTIPTDTSDVNGQVTSNYNNASPDQLSNEASNSASNIAGPTINQVQTASLLPQTNENNTNVYKLTISAKPNGQVSYNSITFDAMPSIQETQSATYREFSPLQHPGEILKYHSTDGRQWTISVKLFSRTMQEAAFNMQRINVIRSWVMPFYGQGTATNKRTKQYLGAPPPILTMTAYGEGVIGPVKCVLGSFNWTWDENVDWIATSSDGTGQPFPVIIDISMQLKETWSPTEFSNFDLTSYRLGTLTDAFWSSAMTNKNVPSGQPPSTVDTSSLTQIAQNTNAANQAASVPIAKSQSQQPSNANAIGVTNSTGPDDTNAEWWINP
jgi:hypothetical protein